MYTISNQVLTEVINHADYTAVNYIGSALSLCCKVHNYGVMVAGFTPTFIFVKVLQWCLADNQGLG